MTELLENHVRALYRLLNHGNDYSDLRCINVNEGGVLDRRLVTTEQAVTDWAREWNGKGNCFIGRNPRNADGTVRCITTWSFDIDPVRPKGTAANSAASERALFWGKRVLQECGGKGYVASSGNGALVLLRLSLRVDKEFKEFEQKLASMQKRFREQVLDLSEVTCDNTHDSARLIKLVGTTSTKGDRKDWRVSRFVNFPMAPFQTNESILQVEQTSERTEQKRNVDNTLAIGAGDRLKLAQEALPRLSRNRVEDYDSWLKVGIALKEFGDAGLAMWDNWSKQGSKYNSRACEEKWNTFRSDQSLTTGTIVHWANEDSPRGSRDSSGSNDSWGSIPAIFSPNGNLKEHKERLLAKASYQGPELSTGLPMLDRCTWGLIRGELFTIAARTGIGKTSISVSLTKHLLTEGKRVLFFSTEMSSDLITNRLLSSISGIGGEAFRTGRFDPNDLGRLDESYARLEQVGDRLKICDLSSPNIEQVRKLTEQSKPDVLIFDHIQHVGGKSDSIRVNVTEFIRGLKNIARDFNCAVLVLSQLRRMFINPKSGVMPQPQLSDLKESGTIEEESGQVLLLSVVSEEPGSPICSIVGDLAKNRFGECARIGFKFDRSTARFEELEFGG